MRAASLTLLTAVIVVSAVYVLRLDSAAGLIVDDAWYVVLAKAIAQGDGYRLISSGVAPILPSVPPGFPLVLSIVFLIDPAFPSNVFLLKLVSVAAMLGVGFFTWTYARRVRELSPVLAVGLAAATVLTPAFVFLATSTVMAECVFTLAQLAAIWFFDWELRKDGGAEAPPSRWSTVGAGLATGAAILVRSAGVATLAAGVTYLLFTRRYSRAAMFVGVVALTYAPWFVYARANAPTIEERMAHGGAMAYSYMDLLSFREGGVEGSGRATGADLVARVRGNVLSMIAKDFGGIAMPELYRGASESGQEVVSMGASRVLMAGSMGNAAGTLVLSTLLSAIALLGFWMTARRGPAAAEFAVVFSVAMIALVPSWSFRYLLTLAPFLLYYLLAGLQQLVRSQAAPRIALFTIVGLHTLDHAQYIALARDPARIDWLGDAAEADTLFAWMQANLQSEGLIASTNPGLVFLRTGRKAVASDNPMENWREWKVKGVRYMVTLRTVDLPPKRLGYDVKYFSPRRRLWVIDVPPLQ